MPEIKYLVTPNFNNQSPLNFVLENFSDFPVEVSGGRFGYSSTDGKLYLYNNESWISFNAAESFTFDKILGGSSTNDTFIVSTGSSLSFNNNGIINSNQFFGSGIIPTAKGGTGATGFVQNGLLFHINGNFSSNSGLYFDTTNFLLGVGNTGWLGAGGPTARVHVGAGSVNYPQIKLEPTIYTTNLAGNKGGIEYTHSSGLSFIDGGSTRRMISYFGASVTGFTGVVPLDQGGTGRSSYNFGSLIYASGNQFSPYLFSSGNVQALMLVSSGSAPTFLMPGSSGAVLISNGTGFLFDLQSSTAAFVSLYPPNTTRNTIRATGNLTPLVIERSGVSPIIPLFDVKNGGSSLFRIFNTYTELNSPKSTDYTFIGEFNDTILEQSTSAVFGGTLYLPDGDGTLAKSSDIPVVYGVSGIVVSSGIGGGYQIGWVQTQDSMILNNLYVSGKIYGGGSPTGALQFTSIYDLDTGINFDTNNGLKIYASGQEIALFKSASGINTITLQNQLRVLGDVYVSGIVYTPSGALGHGGGGGGTSDHSALTNLNIDSHLQYIYAYPTGTSRNAIIGTGSISLLSINRSGSFPIQDIFNVQNNGSSVFRVFNAYSELSNLRTSGVYFSGPFNPTTLGQEPNATVGGSIYLPDGNGTLAVLGNIPYLFAGTGIIVSSGSNSYIHVAPVITQNMNFGNVGVTGSLNVSGSLNLNGAPVSTASSGILAGTGILLSTNGLNNLIHLSPNINQNVNFNSNVTITGNLNISGLLNLASNSLNHSSLTGLFLDSHPQYIYNSPVSSTRNSIVATGSLSLLSINRSGNFPVQSIFDIQNNSNSVFRVFNGYSELNNLRTSGILFSGPSNNTTIQQDPAATLGGSLYLPDGNGTIALLGNVPYIFGSSGILATSGSNQNIDLRISDVVPHIVNFNGGLNVTGVLTVNGSIILNGSQVTASGGGGGGGSSSGILAGSGIQIVPVGLNNFVHFSNIVPREINSVSFISATGDISTNANFDIFGTGSLTFASGSNVTNLYTEATGLISLKLPAYAGTLNLANNQLSPTQISSNQNDYDIGFSSNFIRISSDVNGRRITGFANGYAGREIIVTNIGSFDIVIRDQDTNSLSENRIYTSLLTDVVIKSGETWRFIYDSVSSFWRIYSGLENYKNDHNFCSYFREDFFCGVSNSTAGTMGSHGWSVANFGAGAAATAATTGIGPHWGTARLNVGTVATGRCLLFAGASAANGTVYLDGNSCIDLNFLFRIPNTGITNDNVYCNLGFGYMSSSAIQTRGVSLFMGGSATGNWQFRSTNSITTSGIIVNSNIPVSTQWTRARILKDVDHVTAKLYINESLCATISGNALLPTGNSINYYPFFAGIQKASGLLNKFLDIDSVDLSIYRNSRRGY